MVSICQGKVDVYIVYRKAFGRRIVNLGQRGFFFLVEELCQRGAVSYLGSAHQL